MGWGGGWEESGGGSDLQLEQPVLGGAIYRCGEDPWEPAGQRAWSEKRTRFSNSKVKEVIISYSFPAGRVSPGNPIFQAEKTRLSPMKSMGQG